MASDGTPVDRLSPPSPPRRGRRFRFDTSGYSTSDDKAPEGGTPGQLVVVVLVLALAVLWGGLFVAFRHWRSGYRARAAFGVARVTRAIEPLAGVVPAGEASPPARAAACVGAACVGAALAPETDVAPAAWRGAVADTRAMLDTLVRSNVLDRPRIEALAAGIDARVARARARPATARAELSALWAEAEAGAGPIVTLHHPRPALLTPRPRPSPPRAR